MSKLSIIFILYISFLSQFSFAQNPIYGEVDTDTLRDLSRQKVKNFIEVGLSANSYWGDLSGYNKLSPAFQIAYKFNNARVLNGRIALSTGFFTSENLDYTFFENGERTTPNTFFRTNFVSLQYELHVNLLKTRQYMIYLSQGLGLLQFTTKDEEGRELVDLQETRANNETYNTTALILPTGIGGAYILKNGFGIGLQLSLLLPQTDYLDNISEWGKQNVNDNIFQAKLWLMIPRKKAPLRQFPPRQKGIYGR